VLRGRLRSRMAFRLRVLFRRPGWLGPLRLRMNRCGRRMQWFAALRRRLDCRSCWLRPLFRWLRQSYLMLLPRSRVCRTLRRGMRRLLRHLLLMGVILRR